MYVDISRMIQCDVVMVFRDTRMIPCPFTNYCGVHPSNYMVLTNPNIFKTYLLYFLLVFMPCLYHKIQIFDCRIQLISTFGCFKSH